MSDASWCRFVTYARRIKHMELKEDSKIMDVLRPMRSTIMPKLVSIRITEKACTTSLWCIPPSLQKLDISLGFRPLAESHVVEGKCNAAAEYLEEAQRACLLATLHFRGRMTERLNRAVAALTSLSVLHLRASKYLTAQTVACIAQFPSIRVLNVWAQHIDADEVIATLPPHTTIFPALEDLRIEAKADFANTLLPLFPVGQLRKLHIEVDNDTIDLPLWQNIFAHIQSRFSTSLQTLDVVGYQHLDEEDDTSDDQTRLRADTYITLHTLRPLASLHTLQHLTFTVQLPMDFTDDQLLQMVKWWPLIETIDFGKLPCYLKCDPHQDRSSITLAVFAPIAKACPRLQILAIPVNIDVTPAPNSTAKQAVVQSEDAQPHPLRTFSFGRIIGPAEGSRTLAGKILEAFPSIAEISSFSEDVASKSALDTILEDLRSCNTAKASTSAT